MSLGSSSGMLRFNGATGSDSALFDLGSGSGRLSNPNGDVTINLGGLQGEPNTTLPGRQTGSGATATTYIVGGLNTDCQFNGRIVDAGDSSGVSITKVGTGALTLTGSNTYTGDTEVSAGTLIVNNTTGSATGTGDVAVDGGATLAGSGFINGSVNVDGGILSPGNSAGTLTIRGDLTVGASSIFNFDLGATSDSIAVNGS